VSQVIRSKVNHCKLDRIEDDQCIDRKLNIQGFPNNSQTKGHIELWVVLGMVKTPNQGMSLSFWCCVYVCLLWDHQEGFSLVDAVQGVPATELKFALVISSDLYR
jgi:hypothetical protein